MTMMSNNNNMNGNAQNFGDTSLTKVFVGGLAWETPKEALRDHFDKFGDILEAVIISDKITARSKGYGFVTFKNADAAKKACEDSTPIINGRRANCNLAALGARRPRSTSNNNSPPPQQVTTVGPRAAAVAVAVAALPQAQAQAQAQNNNVQWYYRTTSATASPFHHHQALPFYGYSPTYIATTDINYNHKVGYGGGSYVNGHFGQMYPGQAVNPLLPMYPLYHFHQSHAMGLPAQMYSVPAPALMPNKPISIAHPPPNAVCLAVE